MGALSASSVRMFIVEDVLRAASMTCSILSHIMMTLETIDYSSQSINCVSYASNLTEGV
jgi:hypothetical protein